VLFTEPTFLFLFLPILLALYFLTLVLVPARGGRAGLAANWILLGASVVFYARGGGRFLWLLLVLIAFNFALAIGIDRARKVSATRAKSLLAATVGIDLSVLGVCKYAHFVAANLNALLLPLRAPALVVPQVLLPIGISFFIFHAIRTSWTCTGKTPTL
jgi:alginate O-acetyltransferase complex protein AlgI